MEIRIQPRIETINSKKLIGQRLKMSMADYRVSELWRSFRPRRKEIKNNLTASLFSIAVYSPRYFTDFRPDNQFEKWAATEVNNFNIVPPGMEPFHLPGGLYAVFDYKGLSADPSIFQYIFETWLPVSTFTLDHRPHFEILGESYRNNNSESEEEIWIPLKEM